MLNQDFKDILLCLNDEEVEYIVVGAYALAAGRDKDQSDIAWLKKKQ
jgi:hypothetical protein